MLFQFSCAATQPQCSISKLAKHKDDATPFSLGNRRSTDHIVCKVKTRNSMQTSRLFCSCDRGQMDRSKRPVSFFLFVNLSGDIISNSFERIIVQNTFLIKCWRLSYSCLRQTVPFRQSTGYERIVCTHVLRFCFTMMMPKLHDHF